MRLRWSAARGGGAIALWVVVSTGLLAPRSASAQGCILTRNMAPVLGTQISPYLQPGELQIGANYRQFTADHQYQGTALSPSVTALGTNVISKMRNMEIAGTYAITTQWNISASVPLILDASSNRALPANVAGSPRFVHSTSGLGDITIGVRRWLLNCDSNTRQNVSVGVGLKMPTGNSNATDMFPNALGQDIRDRPVDQSIQLGDGGWGFSVSAEGFKQIGVLSAFASGVYVFNPKGQNDTLSPPALLSPLGPTAVDVRQRYNSVSDSYLARAGVGYALPKPVGLSLTLAARVEGVPVHDVFGTTAGFRRPGDFVTIEPGAIFGVGRTILFVSVPIRVSQDVKPSLGFARDSTFADHAVLAGTSFTFGGR